MQLPPIMRIIVSTVHVRYMDSQNHTDMPGLNTTYWLCHIMARLGYIMVCT